MVEQKAAEGAVVLAEAGATVAAEADGAASPAKRRSELSRAFAEDGPRKTHVGGQALIEGVMMRGTYNWAVGVREPDGALYVEEHDLASGRAKNGWMHWPVVRGCRAFVESLMLGYKALEVAAIHAFGDEEEGEGGAGSPAAAEAEGAAEVKRPAAGAVAAACGSPRSDAADGGADDVQAAASADALAESAAGWDEASEPLPEPTLASTRGEGRAFSWKDDFGNPDEMIDALGAQRTLEVVCEPLPVDAASAARAGASGTDRAADSHPADGAADEAGEGGFGKKEMALSMVLGLALGVALFIVAPAFLTNLIVGEYDSNALAWNIVDGILRVAVFVFYIWLIGRMQEIKRMFAYHGAEHKTIHCHEHGLPLTPENARRFPRLHVRCGTAFLIMVMIIAIFVYTAIPLDALIGALGVPDGAPKLALVIAVRIVFLPVIAGVSYEITVKWAGSHPDNPLVKVVLWPGMQMQRLTTKEPDDGMLECAIAAMQRVLAREDAEAARRTAA